MNEVLSALGRNFPSFAKLIRVSALVAATLLTLTPATSRATSYASGLTNDNGTIRFYLNESADNVKVILDLGGGGTNDLGALATGRHSFSLGSATNYQIVVARSSGAGWMLGVTNQISSDTNILMRFVNQRGVVVNRDPASPYFGRVYVSVSALGTNTASGRVLGEGVYVLNPDFTDALGQGNTALTGGLPFSSASAESPHRLSLGPDGNLYICDWSDQTGTLCRDTLLHSWCPGTARSRENANSMREPEVRHAVRQKN